MGNSSSKNDKIIQPKFLGNMPKPWDLSKIEPQIVVFRKNKEKIVITHEMSEEMAINSLIESELLPTNRIIFIAHGFLTTQHKQWLHSMKDLMIEERDQTVCIIGWGNGADIGILKYEQASANALAVGQWLAKYAKALRQRFNDLYIWGLGHSLGAHLMGMSGRESQVFDRITGLDPAGVGFQVENEDKRLNFSDAKLVDVIHSDGKNVPYFGTLLPLGSIDFYPNYGWNQPTYDDSNKKPYMFESQDEPKAEQISPYGDGFTTRYLCNDFEFNSFINN
jgi:hypothetical protein